VIAACPSCGSCCFASQSSIAARVAKQVKPGGDRGGADRGGGGHGGPPYGQAARFLGWAARNYGELDGDLLRRTGAGLGRLTIRQVCNVAFATITSRLDEEQRAEFLEELREDDTSWEEQAAKVYAQLNGHGKGRVISRTC
jgi:hypothetical protein